MLCEIYTDGSHIKGTTKLGGGAYCCYDGEEYEFSFSFEASMLDKYKIPKSYADKVSNPTMEFLAFAEVLDRIVQAKPNPSISFVFYIDYQGVECWMNGKWRCKEEYIRKIYEFCIARKASIKNSITIEYVPSKSNEGNRKADELAKSGINRDNLPALFEKLSS